MSFNVACIERTSSGQHVFLVDSNDKERTVTVWYPKLRLPRVDDHRTTTPSCFDLYQETYALLDSELLAVVKQAEIACTVHDIEYTETLPDDTVFVFGSNEAGRHGAGAAYTAAKCFGAKYGEGIGHFGQSYAIPTKDKNIKKLTSSEVFAYICDFITYAQSSDKKFFVTKIGCGLAGFDTTQIAAMFKLALYGVPHEVQCRILLPLEFYQHMNTYATKLTYL